MAIGNENNQNLWKTKSFRFWGLYCTGPMQNIKSNARIRQLKMPY